MDARNALIAGATGLVGRCCLRRLLAEPRYSRVTAIVRRTTGVKDGKLDEVVVDFDRLADRAAAIRGDDVFLCLGTTIKAAGSRDAFRRVDHDLVVELARLARANGARRLAHVSSVGADPGSRNFYLRTKGETERDLGALGFERIEVLRPSFLIGERERGRPAEAAGIAVARGLSGLLLGGLRRYRPIEADTVSAALIASLREDEPGVRVREFDEIVALASQ